MSRAERDNDMDWILGLLPLLLFAACPLMMVFCFFGMRRMGCSTEAAPATNAASVQVQNLSASKQIAALQAQLSQLQFEQMAIARQIDELAAATTNPGPVVNDPVATVPAGSSV